MTLPFPFPSPFHLPFPFPSPFNTPAQDNTAEYVVGALGVFWARCVLLPANPNYKAPEFGQTLRDGGARLLLVGPPAAAAAAESSRRQQREPVGWPGRCL